MFLTNNPSGYPWVLLVFETFLGNQSQTWNFLIYMIYAQYISMMNHNSSPHCLRSFIRLLYNKSTFNLKEGFLIETCKLVQHKILSALRKAILKTYSRLCNIKHNPYCQAMLIDYPQVTLSSVQCHWYGKGKPTKSILCTNVIMFMT